MKMMMVLALLLTPGFLLTQTGQSGGSKAATANRDHGEITVRGCLSMLNGDYVLMRENPGITYQVQANDKVRLGPYLGKRVEVTGATSPTLSTSEDEINRAGSASPVTIAIDTIKTLSKECQSR